MWTEENRDRHDRSKLRYPSDLTDVEWRLIAPLIPPARRGGNKRTVVMREVVNGVMYVLSTGCQWNVLPKDLPPKSTVNDYFRRWDWDGTLGRIHHALYVQCREQAGREASPTAAIIDSQGVKSAEKGGSATTRRATARPRRSRAGSATSWMQANVHAADVQDRDGGVLLMATLFGLYPFLLKLYADSGYQGPKFTQGLRQGLPTPRRRDRQAERRGQVRRPAEAVDCRANHCRRRIRRPTAADAWPRTGSVRTRTPAPFYSGLLLA